MEQKFVHPWPNDRASAYEVRDETVERIEISSNTPEPETIAAIDTAYGFAGESVYASVVVMSFPDLERIELAFATGDAGFPFNPGMIYFREGHVAIRALTKIKTEVDLLMVGRHGICHPRGCGMASHLGVVFDKPSIGIARRLLIGYHRHLGDPRGSSEIVTMGNREVGVAYRSKERVKPIYISPGHRCDLTFAKDIAIRTLRGYRLPEPLRVAHLMAAKHRRSFESKARRRAAQD